MSSVEANMEPELTPLKSRPELRLRAERLNGLSHPGPLQLPF